MKQPHRLHLYRLAVQHPEAEVSFLLRCYEHYHAGVWPTLLKEDFAGTAAIAATWVGLHDDHRALVVDCHSPTVQWAQRFANQLLGDRIEDLYVLDADVLQVRAPKVDVVAALNFSAFGYHDPASLLRYFRAARQSLRPGGIFVMDAFGGPGAMRPSVQSREVHIPDDDPLAGRLQPFTYQWEQRQYDARTGRIDCRIHFTLADGRHRADAFRYDWRLWTLPELCELLTEARFQKVDVWCDKVDPTTSLADGHYEPTQTIVNREDWVAYIVALR